MKICLECGEGGHLDEMLSIIKALEKNDIFFIVVEAETTLDLKNIAKVYYLRDRIGPKLIHVFINAILIAPLCLKILLTEKPRVILSTGGDATIPLSYLGKLFGVKIIYLESLTRIDELSGTGRFIYPIADLFLVQWEGLLRKYKKAKYWGKVI